MFNFSSNIQAIDSKMYTFAAEFACEEEFSHHECRLLAVLEGEITIHNTEKIITIKAEGVIYLPSEKAYRLSSKKGTVILYICFHPCFLLEILGPDYTNIAYIPDRSPTDQSAQLCRKMAALSDAISKSKSNLNSLSAYAKALDILDLVCLKSNQMPKSLPIDKSAQMISSLKTYLNKNYNRAITLSDAGEFMAYTPQYLANLIKKNLNITFNDMLGGYRLKASLVYLKFTAEPVGRISNLCGFASPASFLQTLKKSGYSLEEFSNRKQKELCEEHFTSAVPITHPTAMRNCLMNYLNYSAESDVYAEAGTLNKKHINLNNKSPLTPYWKKLINLGCASDFEKITFRNQLKTMQEHLNFEYGRILGLIKLTKVYFENGQSQYDFYDIFKIIDFMRSINLKPFVDIDNKPFNIYTHNELFENDYRSFLNTEHYDKFLYIVLPLFIKAAINRYGFDEFSTWKFELWRRYTPSMGSLESPKVFVSRFRKVSDIFDSLQCSYSLGGPSFNTYLDANHFEQLLVAFKNSSMRPDFLSVLCFPYIPKNEATHDGDVGYQIVQSPSSMTQKIMELKQLIDSYGFAGVDFYITEYSSYIINANYVNDSNYPATFIMRQAIENYGKTDAMGYWLATDLSLEYNRPTLPLFGGNGLLSRDGIKKAAFYAFQFLNMLGSNLVSVGSNYIVTSSNSSDIQVLLYLSSDITGNIAEDPTNAKLLYSPYYGFSKVPPVKFELHLDNIQAGNYGIREYSLDLKHGNVLSVWGQLNHTSELRPADISYISSQSIPSINQKIRQIDGTYLINTTIAANEAKLLTFERYY